MDVVQEVEAAKTKNISVLFLSAKDTYNYLLGMIHLKDG